jgi:hypothetical protein
MPRPGRPIQTSELFLRMTQAQLVSPEVGAGTTTGVDHGPSVEFDQRMKVLIGDRGSAWHC